MKTNIYFWSYVAHFFLEWEMFQAKFLQKNQNTRFNFNNIFFFVNRAVCDR